MVYSFSLHPVHLNLIYQNSELLGGLREAFVKEYPMESTIFGPIYQHEVLIFIVKWSYKDVYIGQRM